MNINDSLQILCILIEYTEKFSFLYVYHYCNSQSTKTFFLNFMTCGDYTIRSHRQTFLGVSKWHYTSLPHTPADTKSYFYVSKLLGERFKVGDMANTQNIYCDNNTIGLWRIWISLNLRRRKYCGGEEDEVPLLNGDLRNSWKIRYGRVRIERQSAAGCSYLHYATLIIQRTHNTKESNNMHTHCRR